MKCPGSKKSKDYSRATSSNARCDKGDFQIKEDTRCTDWGRDGECRSWSNIVDCVRSANVKSCPRENTA